MPELTLPDVVCPAAAKVEGATPAEGGCRCRIMELDSKQADPVLEGAPIGVFISAREDPHTFFGWCAGDGQPAADPEQIANHYTSCPVFQAAKDWDLVKRLFAPDRPPEKDPALQEAEERGLIRDDRENEMLTSEELAWMGRNR